MSQARIFHSPHPKYEHVCKRVNGILFYRQSKEINRLILTEQCTGLKSEWISTMETTTQFPVDPGTVVEVKCSDPRYSNAGSSNVICATQTEFIYLTAEPWCTTEGN